MAIVGSDRSASQISYRSPARRQRCGDFHMGHGSGGLHDGQLARPAPICGRFFTDDAAAADLHVPGTDTLVPQLVEHRPRNAVRGCKLIDGVSLGYHVVSSAGGDMVTMCVVSRTPVETQMDALILQK